MSLLVEKDDQLSNTLHYNTTLLILEIFKLNFSIRRGHSETKQISSQRSESGIFRRNQSFDNKIEK